MMLWIFTAQADPDADIMAWGATLSVPANIIYVEKSSWKVNFKKYYRSSEEVLKWFSIHTYFVIDHMLCETVYSCRVTFNFFLDTVPWYYFLFDPGAKWVFLNLVARE